LALLSVRSIAEADAEAWLALRMALWPGSNEDQLRREIGRYFVARGEPLLPHRVFVAERRGAVVGMLEFSLRPYADGCTSSPVPFIEGWYVEPGEHRSGVGRALVKTAERWALENGYTEMASDALLKNTDGERAHKALGFREIERAIHVRKALTT
jgi:aminoglycoside 6'-N-acetyltransferase I